MINNCFQFSIVYEWSLFHSCTTSFADLSEPCQISQTHMLHRCNLVAIVGTGPGAKFFNDKGSDVIYQTRDTVFCQNIQTPRFRKELKIQCTAAKYFWRN